MIGDLVIYHNRVLRRIVLTCLAKSGGGISQDGKEDAGKLVASIPD